MSIFLLPAAFAQHSRYIIQIKDKAGTPFTISDPIKFLTQRSLDRRTRQNIPVNETDLPINPSYLDSIRLAGDITILNTSKWLNQVCILTTDANALDLINSFSFVVATAPIAARPAQLPAPVNKQLDPPHSNNLSPTAVRPHGINDFYDYGLAYPQTHLHNAEFLHNLGFGGEGMQLAMMDAGFLNYQTLPTFDSIRNNNQVLGTWDFVANEASVNEDSPHGMNCFSTIAANLPGSFVGTATKSAYYLYRTEDVLSEYPVEEQNFVAAAERADSLGVDIFSVSLGYNTFDNNLFDYNYADLDGNTTIITRACDYAAQKGILVVVAAGNEGNSNWHYLTAPGDADSTLTVGAVNVLGQPAGFSSYGPTSDGRVKPDVVAIGQGAVVANPLTGEPFYNNGTSFATPIMAGIATCLWQAFPEVNNMSVINALRNSSDKTNAPNDRAGNGIPDAKKAFVSLLKQLYAQQIIINGCAATINWTVKSAANMSLMIERKLPADSTYKLIYTQSFSGNFASRDYNFTDDLSGLNTGPNIGYRLKMTIADTSFYLNSATENLIASCAVADNISISPNPVSDNLTVSVNRDEPTPVTVILYSVKGQVMYKNTRQVNGSSSFVIPMREMSKGIYFVGVYFEDRKQVIKKILR